jgi:L-ribulose-5-phosphate 3-epimerase
MFIDNLQITLFSKSFQGHPLEKLSEKLKEMEIKFIDLTVRPGGHVEPEKVEEELPVIHEKLMKEGIGINMITTDITDASNPLSIRILKTAASLGIKYYKLGYLKYQGFGTLTKQRENARRLFFGLAEVNIKYGIMGAYHNHSADFFGAAVWDIYEVIRELPKAAIGFYFDPCHAVIEGGSCGWIMGLELLADRLAMLAIKDFRWIEGNYRYAGARRHSVEYCPLSQGNVPWAEVIKLLRQINFHGPVSFHSEYKGNHCFADLDTEQILKQTASDINFFKSFIY